MDKIQFPECRGDCKFCEDYPCNDELIKAEEAMMEARGENDW